MLHQTIHELKLQQQHFHLLYLHRSILGERSGTWVDVANDIVDPDPTYIFLGVLLEFLIAFGLPYSQIFDNLLKHQLIQFL